MTVFLQPLKITSGDQQIKTAKSKRASKNHKNKGGLLNYSLMLANQEKRKERRKKTRGSSLEFRVE